MTPPSALLDDVFPEVASLRIGLPDQGFLAAAYPALDLLFSSNRFVDVAVVSSMDKPRDAVLPGEAGQYAPSVLVDAAGKVVCDANVERAGVIGHDVDGVFCHATSFGRMS